MTQTTANSPVQSSETPAAAKPAAEVKTAKARTKSPVKTSVKAPVKKTRQTTLPAAKTSKTRNKPVAKVLAKPTAKVPAKPAAKALPKPMAKPAVQVVAKPIKEKKVKVVRDSFTLPKTELLQIAEMKKRAMGLGVEVKKSELIRAGLQALSVLSDAPFKKALGNVPTIKTGRPAKA